MAVTVMIKRMVTPEKEIFMEECFRRELII